MAGLRVFAVTQRKAGKILRDDEIRGKKITKKQRGALGAIRGGKKLTRLKK